MNKKQLLQLIQITLKDEITINDINIISALSQAQKNELIIASQSYCLNHGFIYYINPSLGLDYEIID